MKSTIKNILMGLGLVFVILILAVTYAVNGIWHAASAYQDTSEQSIQATADGFTITTALESEPTLVLDGVVLCGRGVDSPGSYSTGFQCSIDGVCRSEISPAADTSLPQDLTIYAKSDAGCTTRTISNVAQYEKIFYRSAIKLSPEFLEDNGLVFNDDLKKNANSKFNSSGRYGIAGTEIINLDYRSGKPIEDDFILKDKHFHIVYR